MAARRPVPGVSREDRIADAGLERLEAHLRAGTNMSKPVLAQWIRRYGERARSIIRRYGRDCDAFDRLQDE